MIIAGLVETGVGMPIALAMRLIRLVPTPRDRPSCVNTLLSDCAVASATVIGPRYSLSSLWTW